MVQNKILTDNATLSDAALGFYALENNYDFSKSIVPNWLKFIENSVLYDKMVVDNNVFKGNTLAQRLLKDFNNVEGVDLDADVRNKINQNADKKIAELDDSGFTFIQDNQVRSNVKRLFFYLGLSNEINSVYSPSSFRNDLLQIFSDSSMDKKESAHLEEKILENVIEAVKKYVKKIEKESGIQSVVAELPPIASLVLNKAKQCGSWSEAIFIIREKRTVQCFREWSAEVAEMLLKGDQRALQKLSKTNRFIEGWGDNLQQGNFIAKMSFGFQMFGFSIESSPFVFSIPNPFKKKHIVFLNDTFQSLLVAERNWKDIHSIKI